MSSMLLLILGIVAIGLLFVVAPVVIDIYVRYGGKVLNCPETQGPAEVTLKTHRAALLAAFGNPLLRVKSCSLWPKKMGCAEKCIKENWPTP